MAGKKTNALTAYSNWCDGLPLVVKVLFALFLSPIIYGLYRIGRGGIGCGIIWMVVGLGLLAIGGAVGTVVSCCYFILSIVDLVTICIHGKPTIFVDLF